MPEGTRNIVHGLLISILVPVVLSLNTGMASAVNYQIPKTGEITCYDISGNVISCKGTGQDGELQDGVALPSPRFSDNGDKTLTDNLTGLIWPKDGRTDAPGSCTLGAMTWQQALDYVACLNTNDYLGHNDWRLPNVSELESLINLGQPENGNWLQTQGFSLSQDSEYWTSTTDVSQPGNAWGLDNADGCVNSDEKTLTSLVRSVRGGQCGTSASIICLPKTGQTQCYDASGNVISCTGTGQDGELQEGITRPSPRFTDNGDMTVTDNLTGLIWTKNGNAPGPSACSPGTAMQWQAALSYVACLNTNNYLGRTNWRLPNRKELFSIVDYQQYNPSLSTANPFVNSYPSFYWSSSTDAYYLSAWIINFYHGYVGTDFTDNVDYYVWPVSLGGPPSPAIALSPASLSFGTTVGTNPANQTIALSNSGGGTLNWTATADITSPAWLSVGPGSGTGNATLTVAVNASGLAAGTYNKTITVTATGASNTPQTVNVMLTVNPTQPAIALSPASLSFTTTVGTNPANQTIALSNGGGGT